MHAETQSLLSTYCRMSEDDYCQHGQCTPTQCEAMQLWTLNRGAIKSETGYNSVGNISYNTGLTDRIASSKRMDRLRTK